MYSTYNEGKSVVAERFMRTLKNKFNKHMTATGKNVYYDVLDDVVNKYNKNASDILGFENLDKMYLLYECKAFSFKFIYGNQLGLLIIVGIQIWMMYL